MADRTLAENMSACTVCREFGHNRTAHYALCKVCGHERFYANMKELVANSEPNPYGRKPRVYVCDDAKRHAEIRAYAGTLPEGIKPRPATHEERVQAKREAQGL